MNSRRPNPAPDAPSSPADPRPVASHPAPRSRTPWLRSATAWLCLAFLMATPASPARSRRSVPATPAARVLKVLPHFLDRQGRHTVNPSLFDRDAYQFELRRHPELRSGMRFDVLWKGVRGTPSAVLDLKVEMRGSKAQAQAPVVLTRQVFASSDFSQWTRIPIVGPDYEKLGELVSWRVSLWNGDTLLAEQTSFLW